MLRTVTACLCNLLLLRALPALADCSPIDRFTATEQAARVIVGRVVTTSGIGQATVTAIETLKGPAQPARLKLAYNPMEGISLVPRERYVLFLDAAGHVMGGCTSRALPNPREGAEIVDALRSWQHSSDAEARTALLVRLGTHGAKAIAEDALLCLGASPQLLAAVSSAQRDALAAVIPVTRDERAYALSWALARLHAIATLPAWITWLDQPQPGANSRPIQEALELMTNHHDPGYTLGRDFDSQQGALLRAGWIRWIEAHGKEPLSRTLMSGFSERVQRAISLDDPADLADVYTHSTDLLTRLVALNACELRAKRADSKMSQAGITPQPDAVAACTR